MKAYKEEIVNTIIRAAEGSRVVILKDCTTERHIPSHDCHDIMNAVLKRLPNYRAVQLCTPEQIKNPATASLFTTLAFVENGVEFDDGTEFGQI